jgi:hypothetical protein
LTTPEQITSVHARWIHPQIECDLFKSSGFSIWIGADDGQGDLAAVGSSTICDDGVPDEYLWYRDRWGEYTQIDSFFGPATVEALLTTTTRGWQIDVSAPSLPDQWTTEIPYALPATTAIWAAGLPMTSDQPYALAPFGVVPFSNADATSVSNKDVTAMGDAIWPSVDRFDLTDGQKAAAEATAISDGGRAFSIYWRHALTSAPGPTRVPAPTHVPTPSPIRSPSPQPTPLPVAVVRDVDSPAKAGFSAAVPEHAEVTAVSAGWKQPAIVCGNPGGGLFTWVAISDSHGGSVAIGTASVCEPGGPRSYAWTTANGWQIDELGPINPGESVMGSIDVVDGAWKLSLRRSGTPGTYESVAKFDQGQVYASWMLATEPMGGTSAHPLPQFSSTTFTDCAAKVAGFAPDETSAGILGPGWATVTHFELVGRDGRTLVGTSTPTRGGPSAFDLTFAPD